MMLRAVLDLQGLYNPNPEPEPEPDHLKMSDPKERGLIVTLQKIRSKVLAVWKAFESVETVALLRPSSNFMPWTRLFFAKFCAKVTI
jgi:hypothetical protein